MCKADIFKIKTHCNPDDLILDTEFISINSCTRIFKCNIVYFTKSITNNYKIIIIIIYYYYYYYFIPIVIISCSSTIIISSNSSTSINSFVAISNFL